MTRPTTLLLASAAIATIGTGCSSSDGDAGPAATPPTPAAVGATVSKTTALVESPSPRFLADRQGRVVLLRGANMVGSKSGPDYIGPVTEDDVAKLRSYGMNVARQLIYWAAIEPTKGAYDEAYLDAVEKRLDWYAARGVYVVLDMHQDIYSEAVGGDGAPSWAVFTDGKAVTPPTSGPWYLAAASPGVQAAYRNFWDQERGHADLQEHYVAAWKHVAERFASHPAVVAYDIMNEPVFANGDIAATIAFMTEAKKTGDWNNAKLIDFTQRVVDGIRSVDADTYVFYEPTSLVNTNLGGSFGGPFPGDVRGIHDPRNGPPRLGYAPHLYDVKVEQGAGWTPTNPYVSDWEALRAADRDAQGGVLWLGEVGGSADQAEMADYVGKIMGMVDHELMGFALWAFSSGSWSPRNTDGTDTKWAGWLDRPYPRAIAGTPTSTSYDPATRVFRLSFESYAQAYGATEIAVAEKRVYPDGWVAVVKGEGGAEGTQAYSADLQILAVTTDASVARWSVCVAPKSTGCTP